MPEIPLVVDDGAQTLTKTRKALDLLQRLGAAPGEHIMHSAPVLFSGPSAESTWQFVWAGAAHPSHWQIVLQVLSIANLKPICSV